MSTAPQMKACMDSSQAADRSQKQQFRRDYFIYCIQHSSILWKKVKERKSGPVKTSRNCHSMCSTKKKIIVIIMYALIHQMEEERVSKIQKENHMLLNKITHIKQTAGRIDCRNEYVNKR